MVDVFGGSRQFHGLSETEDLEVLRDLPVSEEKLEKLWLLCSILLK